jgi:4-hydroxybenzoate polyprenyltransferase
MSSVAAAEISGTSGVWARLRTIAGDIKLAHSVFALPFAVLGAFLARTGSWPGNAGFVGQLTLVVACMVCARTWAMLFNRLVDAKIDAANPRTARRAIPSGRMSAAQGWSAAVTAAAVFIGATSLFLYGGGTRGP